MSAAHPSTTTKRARTPSNSSGNLLQSPQAPSKAARLMPASSFSSTTSDSTVVPDAQQIPIPNHPLICNLPPTCDRKPTPLLDSNDLERHYATHHAHVCEWNGCRCVFPEARLLELHQTECHDPIAALQKERGQKIFQCHIGAPACGKYFSTPKARRLHLIQAHNYPKEYFFAITNKGVGGLLKKWGDGASLIRKPWKAREPKKHQSPNDDGMDEDEGDSSDDEAEVDDEGNESEESVDAQATPRMVPRSNLQSPHSSVSSKSEMTDNNRTANADDALAASMNSLSLVPDSIRFGRGAKGGFKQRGHGHPRGPRGGRVSRGGGQSGHHQRGEQTDVMDVDVHLIPPSRGHSNLGPAGRGRAGISHVHRGGRGRGGVPEAGRVRGRAHRNPNTPSSGVE